MMIIDGYEITAFTNLSEEVCLKVLDIAQKEFGEIGNFRIEDNEASFEVYKGYFEEAHKIIKSRDKTIRLNLIGKFDDPFYSLCYEIHPIQKVLPNGKR